MQGKTVVVIALGAVLVASALARVGYVQHQRALKLEQFQQVVREEAAQSDVQVRTLIATWHHFPLYEAIPKIDKEVEQRQQQMVKAESLDLSFSPELQRNYVALLASENVLFRALRDRNIDYQEAFLKLRAGGTVTEFNRVTDRADAAAITALDEELKLEKTFHEASSAAGIAYSPVLAPYKVQASLSLGHAPKAPDTRPDRAGAINPGTEEKQ